jgi:outer membrane lipoprotein-sorting protein
VKQAMLKKLWLAAVLVVLGNLPAMALNLNAADAAALARVDGYLNSLKSLQAQFQQVQGGGGGSGTSVAEGTLYILRPGRLRVDYQRGAQLQILSDGTYLVYRDLASQESSTVRLAETALAALVKQDVKLASDFQIVGFVRSAPTATSGGAYSTLAVSVMPKTDGNRDMLILFFKDGESPELLGWSLRNAQGESSTLNFTNLQPNLPLKAELFKLNGKTGAAGSSTGSGAALGDSASPFHPEVRTPPPALPVNREDKVRTTPVSKSKLP